MDESITEQTCPHCGVRNRLPARRVGDDPACGRCRCKLFPGEPVAATDATFGDLVEHAPIPSLVDFWASWCGPCRSMEPVLERIARDWRGRVRVVKVDVDANPRLAARFAVRSIPALKLFRGAAVLEEVNGAVPGTALESVLRRHLGER